MRSTLKQQMEDKQTTEKRAMVDKVRESQDAVERDYRDRSTDALDHHNRFQYLKTFRDDNKKV